MQEDVTVYFITGKQWGPLTVPRSWCEECDLTVRLVQSTLQTVDPEGSLGFVAKPWLSHALSALRRGGWHPPVLVIDGAVFTQGVVPDPDELEARLAQLVESRRTA